MSLSPEISIPLMKEKLSKMNEKLRSRKGKEAKDSESFGSLMQKDRLLTERIASIDLEVTAARMVFITACAKC